MDARHGRLRAARAIDEPATAPHPEPTPLIQSLNDALLRLIDGLSDPARRRRTALVFVLGYAAVWTLYGLIAKSSQDMNADMAEMVVWTREPALGYPKHPPLLAWILWAWFKVFPLADWSYYVLATLTLAAGIWLVMELSAEWLKGEKLAAVPFLLAVIPFFNFLGLKWDQNSILIPLWALAMWAMLRALDTRHLGWATLAALAAAAAMLSKYWSVFLIAAMALTALFHPKRRDYFRSAAPWVTAGVFLLVLAPHIWWLIRENFPPVTWVTWRRMSASFGETVKSFGEYAAGTAGYGGAAIALVLIFARPGLRALADGFLPRDERRSAAILFWTPILLPFVPATAKNIILLSLWNTPALNLLPVMLLGSPLLVLPRLAVLRIATLSMLVSLVALIASPLVAYAILKRGVENNAAYARLVMEATEQEWRAATDKPLKLIAGNFVLVSSAAFYGTDKPSTFASYSLYLSPWVDAARITRDGMAIMCANDDEFCLLGLDRLTAGRTAGRGAERTLTRRWLWFESAPKRFTIVILPPQS
jgi:4-amino-4-deoxy-L-arabinose transferase-like glycosyltransferase